MTTSKHVQARWLQPDEQTLANFFGGTLIVIGRAENGKPLSAEQQEILITKLPDSLANVCVTNGARESTAGFIMLSKRLGRGERLESFDRDALQKLKKFMSRIIDERHKQVENAVNYMNPVSGLALMNLQESLTSKIKKVLA